MRAQNAFCMVRWSCRQCGESSYGLEQSLSGSNRAMESKKAPIQMTKNCSMWAIIIVVFVASGYCAGDLGLAKQAISLSGVSDAAHTQFRSLINDTRTKHPELPASTWDRVEKEAENPEFEQSLAKFWSDAYTTTELKQIVGFLTTPTGKKFFKNNPAMMQKLSATAALQSIKIYSLLQKLHPDKFPADPKQDAQIKQLFEVIQKNGNGGRP